MLLKLQTLASEFADMKVTIQTIETFMNSKEAEYVDNNMKIEGLKSRLNGIETDIIELKNDLAALHSEVSKLKGPSLPQMKIAFVYKASLGGTT